MALAYHGLWLELYKPESLQRMFIAVGLRPEMILAWARVSIQLEKQTLLTREEQSSETLLDSGWLAGLADRFQVCSSSPAVEQTDPFRSQSVECAFMIQVEVFSHKHKIIFNLTVCSAYINKHHPVG